MPIFLKKKLLYRFPLAPRKTKHEFKKNIHLIVINCHNFNNLKEVFVKCDKRVQICKKNIFMICKKEIKLLTAQ